MPMNKKIAIIGAGPAGVLTAIFLAQAGSFQITIFDEKYPLTTLLPTGGGRCNLTYFEPDNREFVKYYPRGEKFLLSILSKFNSTDTIEFFKSIGIETYIQEDSRVFPKSESSKEVSKTLNNLLNKHKVNIVRENASELSIMDNLFLINKKHSGFDNVVIATGGKGGGFKLAEKLGHKIEKLKPALAPLKIKNEEFYELSGLTLEKTNIKAYYKGKQVSQVTDDLLFTHRSISGPAVYKTSSLCAYCDFDKNSPLTLKIDVSGLSEEEIELFINNAIKVSPKKAIKNVFSKLATKRLLELILKTNNIDLEKEITHLSKKEKNIIIKNLTALELFAIDKAKGEEIVTAGGICLNEINNKTMESKKVKGLYFCGEVIDIDGFTGGFNLQNCWSTAFVCAEAIKQNS